MTRRGRGRPPIGPEVIKTRFSVADAAQIDRWAQTNGVTRPEAIRQLVRAGLASRSGPGHG